MSTLALELGNDLKKLEMTSFDVTASDISDDEGVGGDGG